QRHFDRVDAIEDLVVFTVRPPAELRAAGIGLTAITRDQARSQQGEGLFAAAHSAAIFRAIAIFVGPAIFQTERRFTVAGVIRTQQEPLVLFTGLVVVTA